MIEAPEERTSRQIRFVSGVLAEKCSIGSESQAPRRAFGEEGNTPGKNEQVYRFSRTRPLVFVPRDSFGIPGD